MCCLFTIFGWLIDSIQRVWVFIMSCCVSSAICCLILTACTSGIALGYNYSLAEYIDLKETNVSVFIKRGVFDDEIAEGEGEARRMGGGPAPDSGAGAEANLRADSIDNNVLPAKSARRLDDSIYESDTQNRFENSLVKLTAKPPHLPPTASTAFKPAAKMEELISNFPPGSLDQMKAMQAVVNARRAGQISDARRNQDQDIMQDQHTTDQYDNKIKFMNNLLSGRKFHIDKNDIVMPSNPVRDAVPRMDLSGWPKGAIPKYTQNMNFFDSNDADYEIGHPPSFPPRPPTPIPSPVRPLTSPATQTPKRSEERMGPVSRTPPTRETPKAVKAFKEDLDKYKQRLLINQYDEPSFKAEDFQRRKPEEDDYEEEFKGAPVRRKRNGKVDSEVQHLDSTTSDPNVGGNPNHSQTAEPLDERSNEKLLNQTRSTSDPVLPSNNTEITIGSRIDIDSSIKSNVEVDRESMMTINFIDDDLSQTKCLKKHKNRKQKVKLMREKMLKETEEEKNI